MSSTSSTVTYTSVYTDSEPGRVFWGADEELSDGEPMYPEYIPLEDDHVLSAEKQPLHPIDSPTAESSRYVAESDPEEDPKEYEDDETEDGPVEYPMDGGDDGDDDSDSSRDDVDDDDDEDEEDGEEEEHLALVDSTIVIPIVELVSPPEGIEPAFIDAVVTALPSPPLPPPIYIPPPVDRRDDIPETEMLPRKRLCLYTLGSRYEIRESSTARPTGGREIDYEFVSTLDTEARRRGIGEVGYGIRDTWVDLAEAVPVIAPMTLREVNTMVTELAELHEHDIQDLYALLKYAQDSRTRISQRVTIDSQRVDLLMGDRTAHQETILIVDEEAYAAGEA
nr:hypothetical protein [Tanacetum cinerariifolium]